MFSQILILMLLNISSAHAATGADDLMMLVGGAETKDAAQNAAAPAEATQARPKEDSIDTSKFVLNDAFALKFLSVWQSQRGLAFEVNAWAQMILNGNYAGAAHLWTAIGPKFSDDFRDNAKAAHLYCLWKLKLNQTFFNQWLAAIHTASYRANVLNQAMETVLAPGFDHWLLDHGIVLNPEQREFIGSLDEKTGFLAISMKALSALRSGLKATPLLAVLPADHAMKLELAQTVMLANAKLGDLPTAAKVLKMHLEPALQARKDPKLFSEYYLGVARLLYQAGSLEGAELYYKKIPSGVPAYLDAHEELMWVYLRRGDTSRLRGDLESLSQAIFASRFSPELYLVRAISNLKLCFYDKVNKDFQAFISSNEKWAKEIAEAEKVQDPRPSQLDFFTQLLERSFDGLNAEAKSLAQLKEASVGAALPAVGPQQHWQQAHDSVAATLESVRKTRSEEYHRQWRNRRQVLVEAIRKMKFVKVEFLSQVRSLVSTDTVATKDAAIKRANAEQNAAQAKKLESDSPMSFPYDGTYWADEVFKLRSVSGSSCAR